ncbi:MAG: immunoglobulin domain-containing protein [Verrucomicrobia bacterium]|nr:immunoglobulin domain-containing protein [Verrucomicrobiota bacterium]
MDSAGANHGTVSPGVIYEDAKVGKGFRLNGTDQWLRIPYADGLGGPTYTVEAWVKPNAPVDDPSNQELILGQSFGRVQLAVRPGTSGVRAVCLFAHGPFAFSEVTSTGEIPIGQFSHLACTWDGTALRIYIDGLLNGEIVPGTSPAPSACPFFIGGFQDGCGYTGQFFNVVIDDPSLYARALSESEIRAIYVAGSAGKCLAAPACLASPTGLVAWWRGEGDAADAAGIYTGTTVGDLVFTAGVVGNAFNFDGLNDSVLARATPPPMLLSFTIEGWIWPTAWRVPILAFSDELGPQGVHLWTGVAADATPTPVPGTLYGNVREIAPTQQEHVIATAPGVVRSDRWTHVALAYDQPKGLATLYVNGTSVTSANVGSFTPRVAHPIYVGHVPPGNSDGVPNIRFTGLMDEIAVFARALTPAEVETIYAAGAAGKCADVPPYILDGPLSQRINVRTEVSFQVRASGTRPLFYQWFHGVEPLAGATNAMLSLTAAEFSAAGPYQVRVSNATGAAASAVADLTVTDPPAIAVQPQGQTVMLGGQATFGVVATGTEPLSYEWFRDGGAIPEAVGPILILSTVQANHGGKYSVRVTNVGGQITSDSALLRVVSGRLVLHLDGGDRRLLTTGQAGANYTVEASSDLQRWTPLATLLGTPADWSFTDTTAVGVSQRFYRLRRSFSP